MKRAEFSIVRWAVVIAVASVAALLLARCARADDNLDCGTPVYVKGSSGLYMTRCDAFGPLTPPDTDDTFHTGWVDYPSPEQKKLKLRLDGSGIMDLTPDYSEQGAIVVKAMYWYWPEMRYTAEGYWLQAWGGPYLGGNSDGERHCAAVAEIRKRYSVDAGAGLLVFGGSMGGTSALLQAMIAPCRDFISIVRADIPHTLPVKWPNGVYWTDPGVAAAWAGTDPTTIDARWQVGQLKNKYIRLNCSPADNIVNCDLDFVRDVCEKGVPCFVTWHNNGHTTDEPGVNLPFWLNFSEPGSDVRLDKMLLAITGSSANYWGKERGHYNLGFGWNTVGFVDTASKVVIPILYRRHTGMGGGIPDQPESVTFDAAIYRIQNLDGPVWWSFGNQRGVAEVVDGEITIPRLTRASGAAYTNLILRPAISGC